VRKFQHNDFAIKTQETSLPDFFQVRMTRMTGTHHQLKKEMTMLRAILMAALLCTSQAALAQELTAAQRNACMGDYEKYCKDVTPGGGRIIACLSKSSDKLTPACKKVLADAEKK
jgi:hypothetical protein